MPVQARTWSVFKDETILDQAGTGAVITGILLVVFGFTQMGTASLDTIASFAELGSQLIGIGIAAIVGGGAVVAYLKN